jgi:hypothetical protein
MGSLRELMGVIGSVASRELGKGVCVEQPGVTLASHLQSVG